MKSNMSIDVEFLAGTSITDCLEEAKFKAKLWNLAYVKFNFNGIKVSCRSEFDTDYWAKKVVDSVMGKEAYVICSVRGQH